MNGPIENPKYAECIFLKRLICLQTRYTESPALLQRTINKQFVRLYLYRFGLSSGKKNKYKIFKISPYTGDNNMCIEVDESYTRVINYCYTYCKYIILGTKMSVARARPICKSTPSPI